MYSGVLLVLCKVFVGMDLVCILKFPINIIITQAVLLIENIILRFCSNIGKISLVPLLEDNFFVYVYQKELVVWIVY